MNFDEIQCGQYANEGHPKLTLFNITMTDIQACEVAVTLTPFITGS
jgi:hypothetical protein